MVAQIKLKCAVIHGVQLVALFHLLEQIVQGDLGLGVELLLLALVDALLHQLTGQALVGHGVEDVAAHGHVAQAGGKPTQLCYFTKDYYWMGSNNTVYFSDSRLFGFVPQDHIIGKASIIWFSKEKETGLFDGYRCVLL